MGTSVALFCVGSRDPPPASILMMPRDRGRAAVRTELAVTGVNVVGRRSARAAHDVILGPADAQPGTLRPTTGNQITPLLALLADSHLTW